MSGIGFNFPPDLSALNSAVSAAALSAAQAASTAAIKAILPTTIAAGGALPNEVSSLSGGIGTGSGGTNGTYAGGVSGGPAGFAWSYTIAGGQLAGYTITNPGISASTAAPTLSLPSGGLSGATVPTATVSAIAVGRQFLAPSADGTQLLAWGNNAGAVASAPFGGTQVATMLAPGVAAAIANSQVLNGAGAPGVAVGANGQLYLDTNTGRLFGPKAGGVWPPIYYRLKAADVIYDPRAMFGGAQAGAIYDLSTTTGLWKDTAGTQPVTADGDAVARIDDKSGNGNHLIQSTASCCPLYHTDGVRGWVTFDGVDDFFVTTGNLALASPTVSIFSAFQHVSNSAAQILFELSANDNSNRGSFYQTVPENTTGTLGAGRSGNSNAQTVTFGAGTPPRLLYTSYEIDLRGTTVATEVPVLRLNGVDAGRATQGAGDTGATSNFQPYPLYVGSRAGTSLFFSGRLYGLVIQTGLAPTALVTEMEGWTQNILGLTPAPVYPVVRAAGTFWVSDYGATVYPTQAACAAGKDSTAAIQAAIDAAFNAGGGTVVHDPGFYKIGGALRTDRGGNAQIALPASKTQKIALRLYCHEPACADTYIYDSTTTISGATYLSTLTGQTYSSSAYAPSVIGTPTTNNSSLPSQYANLFVSVYGIAIRLQSNPTLSAFDLGGALTCHMEDFRVDTTDTMGGIVKPNSPYAYGLILPKNGNNVFNVIGNGFVNGMYGGFMPNEHTQLAGSMSIYKCMIAMTPFTPFNHAAHINGMLNVEWCPYVIADNDFSNGPRSFNNKCVINVAFLDIEDAPSGNTWAPVTHILDANNQLSGSVVYTRVTANVGYTTAALTTSGCANLRRQELSTGRFDT